MSLQALRAYRLVYVSTPYSLFKAGLDAACEAAKVLEASLVAAGIKAYSPIAHTHELARRAGVAMKDHQFWLEYDEPFMAACDAMVIGEIPGWEESFGCDYEEDVFRAAGKPVFLVHPDTLEVVEKAVQA